MWADSWPFPQGHGELLKGFKEGSDEADVSAGKGTLRRMAWTGGANGVKGMLRRL